MAVSDLGNELLTIARSAIGEKFGLPGRCGAMHPALEKAGATFVTLRRAGQLRGCVGSIEAERPLGIDVRRNAIAAAFGDTRFAPLAPSEFEDLAIEVSLLSANERIDVANEGDLVARLRPGLDGLVLEYGQRRATFLPQVWDALPDPRKFVAALKRKAGLPEDFWSPQMIVSRYSVTKWTEREFDLAQL